MAWPTCRWRRPARPRCRRQTNRERAGTRSVNGERIIDAIALHVRRPLALAAFALAAALAHGQSAPPLRKHVASPDYPALLKEPMVKVQLLAVVGKALPALMRNLSVAADVEWISGALAVHGNAPH